VISRIAPFIALVASAAVSVGCGASSTADSSTTFKGEQRLVANTIEDLQSAGERRDASRICNELLAADLVRKIRRRAGAGETCAQRLRDSLGDADEFQLSVRRVSIARHSATATVVSGSAGSDRRTDTVRLVKEGKPMRWRVADLAP
jgi:hypothetical protein